MLCCVGERRFRELSGDPKEVVRASSPVRAAASALLLSPYHSPPPVPPPPHPPGEESDEAHSQGERPLQAMAVPFPCQWLAHLLERGREEWSRLFPRRMASKVEEGLEEGRTGEQPPLTLGGASPTTPPPTPTQPHSSTSALPGCCQSSYRALLMSLLLPVVPTSSNSPPSASPSDSSPSSPHPPTSLSAVTPSPSSPSPSVFSSVHPEAHPEVLAFCHCADTPASVVLEGADGAVVWPSVHWSDAEADGELYFHHLYARFLAMAEGR